VKITVDGVEVYSLSDTQKDVIKNDIASEIFEKDMKRRVKWIVMHRYEQCFRALRAEWDSKLEANGVEIIPTDKDAYADLVFSQPGYEDKSARILKESK
jgi:hypothetical protein